MTYPIEMISCNCLWCKEPFQARKADVKRGWGKFCSKTCKAKNQSSPGGRNRLKQSVQQAQKHLRSPVTTKPSKVADLARDDSFSEYDQLCAAEDSQQRALLAPVVTTRHAYR